MTLFTMDSSPIQGSSIEETARKIREGGFTTGNRNLDWALALHHSDTESDGVAYTKFEDRLRAHPGEQIALLVHQRVAHAGESVETYYDSRIHGALERLWLGALNYPVPDPPVRWEKGELLLPISNVEEIVSYLHGRVCSRQSGVRADGAGLPLSVLCSPSFPLSLREFLTDSGNESVICVGGEEVGRLIAQTYTCLRQNYERALALIRQPSLDLGF